MELVTRPTAFVKSVVVKSLKEPIGFYADLPGDVFHRRKLSGTDETAVVIEGEGGTFSVETEEYLRPSFGREEPVDIQCIVDERRDRHQIDSGMALDKRIEKIHDLPLFDGERFDMPESAVFRPETSVGDQVLFAAIETPLLIEGEFHLHGKGLFVDFGLGE